MDVLIWDMEDFRFEPIGVYKFTNHTVFTDSHMIIHNTSIPQGVLFAELRSYKLNTTFSYGRYYAMQYLGSTLPTQLTKYIRTTNSEFFLNAQITGAPSVTLDTVVDLDVTLCTTAQKFTSDGLSCTSCTMTG